MKREKISETIQNIDLKHVDEATVYTGAKTTKRRKTWIAWVSVAACFILCVSLFLSIGREYVKLDNGDILVFNESTNFVVADMMAPAEIRDLSESEIKSLFKDLPVTTAQIMFGEDGNILGIEGYIDGKILLIAIPSYSNSYLLEPSWSSLTSRINGISVEAGFLFNTNNQTVVYSAEFKLSENTVFIEHSGLKEENDTIKKEIADMIQRLTELGEIDLTIIQR